MKVLNLRCDNGHGFEGWFGSDDDFLDQNGRRLIECPICADTVIKRMPSAPRLNLSGAAEPAPVAEAAAAQAQVPPRPESMQAAWFKAVKHMMDRTEDVGDRFAEEARRIHYGETPERGIRGRASAEQREALEEEGIETFALPLPRALEGPLQ